MMAEAAHVQTADLGSYLKIALTRSHPLFRCGLRPRSRSATGHGVFSPPLLSSGHRTYGIGESSGRIRLRDEPGARRQLAGAGPDAAGPDQDADPG